LTGLAWSAGLVPWSMADGMISLYSRPATHGRRVLAIIPELEYPLERAVYRGSASSMQGVLIRFTDVGNYTRATMAGVNSFLRIPEAAVAYSTMRDAGGFRWQRCECGIRYLAAVLLPMCTHTVDARRRKAKSFFRRTPYLRPRDPSLVHGHSRIPEVGQTAIWSNYADQDCTRSTWTTRTELLIVIDPFFHLCPCCHPINSPLHLGAVGYYNFHSLSRPIRHQR